MNMFSPFAATLLVAVLCCGPGCSDPQPPPPAPPGKPPPPVPNESLCTLPAAPDVWQESPPPLCMKGGWCFSHPYPQGFNLQALAGVSSDDLWAAGEGRLLLHWDGTTYAARNSPAEGQIRQLWGLTADDLWGVGKEGALIHWDGESWARVCSPTQASLSRLSGTAHDDLWAMGTGVLLHFDGRAWTTVELPAFLTYPSAVFAVARDDVWITGSSSQVARWNGKDWAPVSGFPALPLSYGLGKIWGTGAANLWVVALCGSSMCSGSRYFHWDGSAWMEVSPGTSLVGYEGPTAHNGWGVMGGDLFHWDGTTWSNVGPGPGSILPLATPEGYFGILGHMMLRLSDGRWGTLDGSPLDVFMEDIRRIVQRAPDDVWAVGERGLALHFDGVRWSQVPTGTNEILEGLTVISSGDAWAVGNRGSIFHWDGTTWASVPSPVANQGILTDVWGAAANDVWAARSDMLLHYDGTQWSKYAFPAPAYFSYLGGTSPQDVWAVAGESQVWHWDGVAWEQRPSRATSPRYGLWVGAVDDVWTTRGGGWVTHWDGTAWTDHFTGASVDMAGITGSGRADVWALFNSGGLLHWDGASWTQHVPPAWPVFRTLESRAPGQVWVGGGQGRILHYAP